MPQVDPMQIIARLANAQGDAYPRGDGIPLTHAKPMDFEGLEMFLASGKQQERLSASNTIKTPFDFEISSTGFGPKRPAADHRSAGGGEIEFLTTHLTEYEWSSKFIWHEEHLQGNSVLSPEGSQRFYSILKKREKDYALDPLLELEKELFATPSAEMFQGDAAGLTPIKSIFTGCNLWDETYGAAGENLFPGMTSQQGLDPTDPRFLRKDSWGKENGHSLLAPTKVYYSEGGTDNTAIGDHMIEQMRYLMNLMKWQAVPMAGEFGEPTDMTYRYILCTREAEKFFLRTNRAHGDHFAVTSPIGDIGKANMHFNGVALRTSDSLRDAKIYPDVGGFDVNGDPVDKAGAAGRPAVNERDAGGAVGAYFYFFDPSAVNLWMHKDRAWENGPWKSMAPINEDLMRRLGKSIMNLHFESFVTQGILAPSKPQENYA